MRSGGAVGVSVGRAVAVEVAVGVADGCAVAVGGDVRVEIGVLVSGTAVCVAVSVADGLTVGGGGNVTLLSTANKLTSACNGVAAVWVEQPTVKPATNKIPRINT